MTGFLVNTDDHESFSLTTECFFIDSRVCEHGGLIHAIIVIGRAFCFKNHKNYNSLLKLSYSCYFLLFIFILLVRANSGDSGKLIYFHKDSFIG